MPFKDEAAQKAYHKAYYKRPEVLERVHAWNRTSRRRLVQKRYDLKRTYGISLEEYNRLFEIQKGLCLGCYRHQSALNFALAVDHDHKSGKIRGLLCRECNSAIGLAKESPETLKRLADYIERVRHG